MNWTVDDSGLGSMVSIFDCRTKITEGRVRFFTLFRTGKKKDYSGGYGRAISFKAGADYPGYFASGPTAGSRCIPMFAHISSDSD